MSADTDELRMTRGEALALPLTVDVVTAGRAFGIGRDNAYRLARAGGFPCPVLRIGRRYVVTRAALLRTLGIDDAADAMHAPGEHLAAAVSPQVMGHLADNESAGLASGGGAGQ